MMKADSASASRTGRVARREFTASPVRRPPAIACTARPPAPAWRKLIRRYGYNLSMANYRQLNSLGHGGFGEVFVCQRKTDGETFAMKVLAAKQDNDTIARFRREVQLLSSLDHPNVVKVVAMQLDAEPLSYVTFSGPRQRQLGARGGR